MYESKKEVTSIAELRQIEALLDTLETRIRNFRHLLPKPDNRRGLMNIRGTDLKTLFGVATASDIMRLHQTIEELETECRHNSLVRKSDDLYEASRLVFPPSDTVTSKFILDS